MARTPAGAPFRFLWVYLALQTAGGAPAALAWDEHVNLTRAALRGASKTNPLLYHRISELSLRVTPLQSFLSKYVRQGRRDEFSPNSLPQTPGQTPSTPSSREVSRTTLNALLGGVGPEYLLQYTQTYQAQEIILDWERGLSGVRYQFESPSAPTNPQAIGQLTSPLEVLSVYSDEPDWLMDDGVEHLVRAAPSLGEAKGTATRVFRHFWYHGDPTVPKDVRSAQELDKRVRLFIRLSRTAFRLAEPYWGYRFMANAIHYLQDITQPFHVRLLPNSGFVGTLRLAQAGLCDLHLELGAFSEELGNPNRPAPERCEKEPTHFDRQSIQEAWILSAYHMALEDFVNQALVKELPEGLNVLPRETLPLPAHLHFTADAISKIATQIDDRFSEPLGEALLKATGKRWVYHPEEARLTLEQLWSAQSIGILLKQRHLSSNNPREVARLNRLKATAFDLVLTVGELTRQVVAQELRRQSKY